MGPGERQSPADRRRPPVGRCRSARRTAGRANRAACRRRHQRLAAEPRRPRGAGGTRAGDARHPRAPLRRRRRARDRHAQPRVLDPARRRLSHRGRPRARRHHGDDAQRPGRGLRRERGLRRRRRQGVPVLRQRACRLRIPCPAATRRPRSLGRGARQSLGRIGLGALRLARRDGLPGPRCLRRLACRIGLRQRVGAEPGGRRLGPLSRRPLGMDRSVGLDLGRRRAVGLRRVALRPLGEHPQPVVLGAGAGRRACRLCAGAGRLCRREQFPGRHRRRRAPSPGSRSARAKSIARRTR